MKGIDMFLVYDDPVFSNNKNMSFSLDDIDATKLYIKHYENFLVLSFFLREGNREEKQRASKEIEICERKMKFWERHKNFSQNDSEYLISELKKKWKFST